MGCRLYGSNFLPFLITRPDKLKLKNISSSKVVFVVLVC